MKITCPNCKFSRDVADSKIPAQSQKATCPNCLTKFNFRTMEVIFENEQDNSQNQENQQQTEQNNIDKQDYEDIDENQDIKDTNIKGYKIPWEYAKEYGNIKAFFYTVRLALFNSRLFFGSMLFPGTLFKPALFFTILFTINEILGYTNLYFFFKFNPEIFTDERIMKLFNISSLDQYYSLITNNAMQRLFEIISFNVLSFFIMSIIFHHLLKMNSKVRSFLVTARVVAYSASTCIISIIPFIGMMLAFILNIIILVKGLSYAHNIEIKKVAFAFVPSFILYFIAYWLFFTIYSIISVLLFG